jgi:hypothetical protein
MRNITYFDLKFGRPQRGGVYTIAEINDQAEIVLAETPFILMDRAASRMLSVLAGTPHIDAENEPLGWWPSDLFRPFENSKKDIQWFTLLESVRDIACSCGLARRHDGKIYTWQGMAEVAVYSVAFKQFLNVDWGDEILDYWNARDIVDAVNVVSCEADYNSFTLPDRCDQPPPGDGGGEKDRVVQLRRTASRSTPPAESAPPA